MSNADERLVVMLEARITEFEKRMRQAERRGTQTYQGLRRSSRSATRAMEADMIRSNSAINRAMAATGSKIGGFAKAFAGGAAIGAAGFISAAMTQNIGETVKGIARIADEAKRAGMELGAFQEWKFVAEQNRIGVDSLVDGFKELSLRADEFIATGKGPAEEAFRRIGYTGEALSKVLKDPSELMLEIIGRMERLDKAAQIRVADEIFGGTAGERFVELLSQGRAGIEATIQGAHEAGAVLDAELIAKADALDRKFTQLQASASSFFKTVTVEGAAAIGESFDSRASLENIFGDTEAAQAALGSLYERMAASRGMADSASGVSVGLRRAQEDMIGPTTQLSDYFGILETRFRNMGEDELARGIADLRAELNNAVSAFEQSEMSAADFEVKLQDVEDAAYDVIAPLEGNNASRFGVVTGELGGLFGALAAVRDVARQAFSAVAALAGADAAERMDKISEQGERGKQALEDMFGSILDGSMSAKDAVIQLLAEIAKVQMMKGIMGLPGMGGLASAIGGALVPGFASGGDHRGGLRIVGERGRELEATGPARIWNADQTRRMLNPPRQSAPQPSQQQGGTSRVQVDLSPDLIARVLDQAKQQSVQITRQGIQQNNGQIPMIMHEYQKRGG